MATTARVRLFFQDATFDFFVPEDDLTATIVRAMPTVDLSAAVLLVTIARGDLSATLDPAIMRSRVSALRLAVSLAADRAVVEITAEQLGRLIGVDRQAVTVADIGESAELDDDDSHSGSVSRGGPVGDVD